MNISNKSWLLNLLRLKCRIDKKWHSLSGKETALDMARLISFYKKIWQDAANLLQTDFRELANGVWQIRSGDKKTLIHNYKVQIDDPVILDMAGNKPLCYRLLKEKGLPVPEHQVFTVRSLKTAEDFMAKHNGSLFVVKPALGTSGSRGITTHIRSLRECYRASALASLYGDELVIEQLSVGESYRLLILDGKMIHATRRRGVRLTGDGRSNVLQFIEKEKERRCVPAEWDMESDRDLQSTLRAQGIAMESVLDAGKEVLVKCYDFLLEAKSEVRTVFNEDVTGLICRELRDTAVDAARALNSRFAGIDIITMDPTICLRRSGGVINEINTTPGLHHHYNLINDQMPPPAVHVLEYLLNSVDPFCGDVEKKHGTFYQKVERL